MLDGDVVAGAALLVASGDDVSVEESVSVSVALTVAEVMGTEESVALERVPVAPLPPLLEMVSDWRVMPSSAQAFSIPVTDPWI